MPKSMLATAAAAVLAGCAGASGVPPPASFGGGTWFLQSIVSMDDLQGTLHVNEPSRFTLRFDGESRVALRLDCNRAMGTVRVERVNATTGSLIFGPLAGTRTRCLPPQLDERVLRDLGFVRSYRLEGDRLFLSLLADGGIYEWRRVAD
jgi:heat shock protein HslJ